MIIVKLMGGLGNQMFQYAAARRLAYVNRAPLKLDLHWFDNVPKGDTTRKYGLHVFDCVQEVASESEVKSLRGMDISRWPGAIKRLLKSCRIEPDRYHVREKHYHFEHAILAYRGDASPDGFWKSPKYFDDVTDMVRNDFTFVRLPDSTTKRLLDQISSTDAVSIHVRRGDYVSNAITSQYHGLNTMEYYRSAIKRMLSLVPEPVFYVFSDDLQWVKNELQIDGEVVYVEHNNSDDTSFEDMRLMSACKDHIIANSSFSWWGAWLNPSRSKTVIAPKMWFNETTGVNTRDLLPGDWIRL